MVTLVAPGAGCCYYYPTHYQYVKIFELQIDYVPLNQDQEVITSTSTEEAATTNGNNSVIVRVAKQIGQLLKLPSLNEERWQDKGGGFRR
jgi:hypothetical protein